MSNIKAEPASKNYVCINNDITISNDTLILKLYNSYEQGVAEAEKTNFGKFTSSFFSISISLLLTFLTSETYKPIGGIPSNIISFIVLFLFICFFVLGIIASSRKRKTEVILLKRDKAVEDIIKKTPRKVQKEKGAEEEPSMTDFQPKAPNNK